MSDRENSLITSKYNDVKQKILTSFKTQEQKNTALQSLENIKKTVDDTRKDIQEMYIARIYNFLKEDYPGQLQDILQKTGDTEDKLSMIETNILKKVNQSNWGQGSSSGKPSSLAKTSSTMVRSGIIGGETLDHYDRYNTEGRGQTQSGVADETPSDSPDVGPPPKSLSLGVESLGFEYKDLLDSLKFLNYLYFASLKACELILTNMTSGKFGSTFIDYGKALRRIESVLAGIRVLIIRVIKAYFDQFSYYQKSNNNRKSILVKLSANQDWNEFFIYNFFVEDDRGKFSKVFEGETGLNKVSLLQNTTSWINGLKEALGKLKEGQPDDVVEKIDETIGILNTPTSGGKRKMSRSTKKNKKLKTKKHIKSRKMRKSMRHKRR